MNSSKERFGFGAKALSLVLGGSALFIACSDSGKQETPIQPKPTTTGLPVKQIETPASTLSPEQGTEVKVIISYYLSSEIPNLALDENCGHWLLAGDKSMFSSPLPPGDKTITFDAELTLQPGTTPLFGGLPAVPNTHLKAEIPISRGVVILPLGKISNVEPTRIYFTPYLPGNGIPNANCIQPQQPLT